MGEIIRSDTTIPGLDISFVAKKCLFALDRLGYTIQVSLGVKTIYISMCTDVEEVCRGVKRNAISEDYLRSIPCNVNPLHPKHTHLIRNMSADEDLAQHIRYFVEVAHLRWPTVISLLANETDEDKIDAFVRFYQKLHSWKKDLAIVRAAYFEKFFKERINHVEEYNKFI